MEKLGKSNIEDRNCRKKLQQELLENLSTKKQNKKDEI